MRRTTLGIVAVAALAALLFLALPHKASAHREWAIGEWKLWQNFSQHHEETTFQGRLRIGRDGNRFYGRIYFDVVGEWERLEDVVVGDDTIRFTRPKYQQEFHGQLKGEALEGTYRDAIHGDKEWTWRAEKD
jgi:hypothetical protein